MTGLKYNIHLTSKSLSWTLVREGGGWWQICCADTRPHSSFHHTITVHYWGNVLIRSKSDRCLALTVSHSVTDVIETWLMWSWWTCLSCCWAFHGEAVKSFDSCSKPLTAWQLSTALEADTSCWQLSELMQAVNSFGSLHRLSTAKTSCYQLLTAYTSCEKPNCCNKLSTALTVDTSCCQLWQIIEAFDSLHQELWLQI